MVLAQMPGKIFALKVLLTILKTVWTHSPNFENIKFPPFIKFYIGEIELFSGRLLIVIFTHKAP
jgi:hypothetical protein